MIPTVVTRAVLAEEIPAVLAWAMSRPGWTAEFDEVALHLTVRTSHPATNLPLRLQADLAGYRAVAPAWCFLDAEHGEVTGTPFPQPGAHPLVPGSIFHPNRVICAPWNRLAYQEYGGPHGDWGALTGWTVADMLCQVELHLAVSPGVLP